MKNKGDLSTFVDPVVDFFVFVVLLTVILIICVLHCILFSAEIVMYPIYDIGAGKMMYKLRRHEKL